jgi:hypothetical protein
MSIRSLLFATFHFASFLSLLLTLAAWQGLRQGAVRALPLNLINKKNREITMENQIFETEQNLELIRALLKAENFKLAKFLLDNLDLSQLLLSREDYYYKSSYHNPFNEIGLFGSKESFNFLIDYFYQNQHQKIIKKILKNSLFLDSIANLANQKNFTRLAKLVPNNWWMLNGFESLKNAITRNNLFVFNHLLKIAKAKNFYLSGLVKSHYFADALKINFCHQPQDLRILKLLNLETSNIGEVLISVFLNENGNSRYINRNYSENLKATIQKIVRIFKVKEINYLNHSLKEAVGDKQLFFYLFHKTKRSQRDNFFEVSEYNNLSRLLASLANQQSKIDKDVARFLLKSNLKMLANADAKENQ